MRALVIVVALLIPALASADWCASTSGAIAWSRSTGRVGWSWAQSSEQDARDAAIQACGVSDCTWRVSESNGCAALATGAGGVSGWAWNDDLGDAKVNALEACSARGTHCKLVASTCN